jgi:hypothetical protein
MRIHAGDEHPVGALSAYGVWRCLDHFESFPGEHGVEDSGEFAVS